MTTELTTGAFVWTADGREIGRVKKVAASAFQVDAPLAFDYWLDAGFISSAEPEKVVLSLESAQVGAYKMDSPNDQNGFQEIPRGIDPASVRDRAMLG